MSTIERQIYYHDTDAGGVVYYANYLKYLEEARTRLFDDLGLGVKAFTDRGFLYAVRYCHVDYKSPARYGDVIVCDAKVSRVTGAQIIFAQQVRHAQDGRILVEAEVGVVCLSRDFRPQPLPDDIRSKLVPV